MIDSHAHLNDPQFSADLAEVVARAEQNGVSGIINVGYDLLSSQKAVQLVEEYPGLYAVVGVHPHDAKTWDSSVEQAIADLAAHAEVLAIGESGLTITTTILPRCSSFALSSLWRAHSICRSLCTPATRPGIPWRFSRSFPMYPVCCTVTPGVGRWLAST